MGMDANTHGQRENRLWSMSTILTAEQFRAVNLVYVEEMTQAEAAREIGLSQQMVSFLLNQAFERLRAAKNIVFDFDPARI
jgi:DNA-directed RNA polymerase specialized sigma24 family protein